MRAWQKAAIAGGVATAAVVAVSYVLYTRRLANAVEMALGGRREYVVDVGAGEGSYARALRPHAAKLIAIEPDDKKLGLLTTKGYDEVWHGTLQDYLDAGLIPQNSALVMLDVIEHFDKDEGIKRLQEAQQVADVIVVATPSKFRAPIGCYLGLDGWATHRSLWTPSDLEKLGFDVFDIERETPGRLYWGNHLFAVWNRPQTE